MLLKANLSIWTPLTQLTFATTSSRICRSRLGGYWCSANDLVEFSTALVYFDDHQSGYRRLIEAQRVGFGHLLFDDGYPWPGDNYSLKQALDVEDDLYTVEMNQKSSQKLWRNLVPYQDNFNSFRTQINHEEKECIYSDVRGRINVYFEFPPLWEGPGENMVYRHICKRRENQGCSIAGKQMNFSMVLNSSSLIKSVNQVHILSFRTWN